MPDDEQPAQGRLGSSMLRNQIIREYEIDLGRSPIYEAGATLLALLAHPEATQKADELRADLFTTLCAYAIRERAAVDPGWASTPQAIKPLYLTRSERNSAQDLKILRRRLRHRMTAGYMAMMYLKEAVQKETFVRPKGLRSFSLNALSVFVLETSGQAEPGNVKMRIWQVSKPVVHLAAAVETLKQLVKNQSGRVLMDRDLLLEEYFIKYVISTGEAYRELLLQSRAKLDPETLISLRLV